MPANVNISDNVQDTTDFLPQLLSHNVITLILRESILINITQSVTLVT